MRNSGNIWLSLVLTCALLCCGSCAQVSGSASAASDATSASMTAAASPAEPAAVDEGVDTPCQVSYAPYSKYAPFFLSEGDKVAVISPSALPTREQADATMAGLKAWGYVPVEGKHVCEQGRTLTDCVEDLTWALTDPEIKAIFCVRGGYGLSEVMDALPLSLVASGHKLIIGYSDISVGHAAWTVAGLPSVHASMSTAFTDLPDACVEAERRMLAGEIPTYTCEASDLCREGEATGTLIGGNLSTIASVLGTAYDCTKIDGPYILFLEDISEDMRHVHRLLTILKHLGVLDRAAGIVFGEWTAIPNDGDSYGASRGGLFASMDDMISREILPDIDVPVAFGFPAGHGKRNYPLLMGAEARLEVRDGSFTISWI